MEQREGAWQTMPEPSVCPAPYYYTGAAAFAEGCTQPVPPRNRSAPGRMLERPSLPGSRAGPQGARHGTLLLRAKEARRARAMAWVVVARRINALLLMGRHPRQNGWHPPPARHAQRERTQYSYNEEAFPKIPLYMNN